MRIEIMTAPTPALEALVDTHVTFCDGTAPAESCHRLPVSALFASDITIWGAFEGDELFAMGAVKELPDLGGEVKSMHTYKSARGKGTARRILETIVAEAKARGYRALWLETGVHPDFSAARAMYASYGFRETAPFGNYRLDPHSVFMTLDLTGAGD